MPLSFVISASGLLAIAAYTDVTRRIIPNWIPITLILLFIAASAFRPIDSSIVYSFLVAAAVFTVLAVAFAFNVLGGGDVKLMAAVALWVGLAGILEFFLITAMVGGALALGMIAYQRLALVFPIALPAGSAGTGAPAPTLPYGVAIAAAGCIVMIAQHASL
jgi:prepilin peptidase CpaA